MALNSWQRNIVDESGNVISGAEVEVFYAGTTDKPDLFSDNTGTPKLNPFNADTSGFAQFFCSPASVDIAVNGTILWADVNISDLFDEDMLGDLVSTDQISGFVTGPASSANDQLALFDGITGKLLKVGQTIAQYLDAFLVTLYNYFPRTVNTFANLGSLPSVGAGQIVKTRYYEIPGYGACEYIATNGSASRTNYEINSATPGIYWKPNVSEFWIEHFGGRPVVGFNNNVAINSAIAAFPWSGSAHGSGGTLNFQDGDYEHSYILVNRPVIFRGRGKYSTRLVKNSAGIGIEFQLDTSAGGGLKDIASVKKTSLTDGGLASHGVILNNGRAVLSDCLFEGHGGIGCFIRNNNCVVFKGLESVFNGSHGVAILGQPAPDNNANGMSVLGIDSRGNGGSGLYMENCFANNIIGPSCQANGRYAIELGPLTQLHNIRGVYSEANTLGSGLFDAGSNANRIQYNIIEDANPVNNGTNNSVIANDDDTIGIANLPPIHTNRITLGPYTSGANGTLSIKDSGSQYEISLEGTGGNATLEIKSAGAGTLTTKFQNLHEDTENLTLQNSWVQGTGLGVPRIYKDSTKRCFLSGAIQAGTATAGTLIANVSAAYRPGSVRRVVSANSAGVVILQISTNGNVTIEAGTNAVFSLDGLSYHL